MTFHRALIGMLAVPALANAVADATGVRIREIPFSAARVRDAIGL